MPFNLSTGELLVLAIVAILVFGGRLPEVSRKVGRSISEFKRGMSEEMRKLDFDKTIAAPPPETPRIASHPAPAAEEEEAARETNAGEQPEG